MNGQFSSLDEFWPFYLSQHLNPKTRGLHFAGTTAGLILLSFAAIRREPRLLAAALVAAYGCAWIGHFFFERNSPATFQYPLLSLRADFRMYWMGMQGTLERELRDRADAIRAYRRA
jgi:hypothetical protein